jgi:catechol 2,3-dioxygenase-like lactoylglutathione lyase family enzyme
MKPVYKNVISYLWVKNTKTALEFYANILGCKIIFESDGWAELSVPGAPNTFLALNKWGGKGEHPLNDYLTLGIDDLNGFRKFLESHRVHLIGEIREFPEQGMRMFKFQDPDGNTLTVSEVEL